MLLYSNDGPCSGGGDPGGQGDGPGKATALGCGGCSEGCCGHPRIETEVKSKTFELVAGKGFVVSIAKLNREVFWHPHLCGHQFAEMSLAGMLQCKSPARPSMRLKDAVKVLFAPARSGDPL